MEMQLSPFLSATFGIFIMQQIDSTFLLLLACTAVG
jgi:hypothetical protein